LAEARAASLHSVYIGSAAHTASFQMGTAWSHIFTPLYVFIVNIVYLDITGGK
jgi:hypothetical protein